MSLHPPLYPLTVLRSSSQRALIRQQTATVHFSELACISATAAFWAAAALHTCAEHLRYIYANIAAALATPQRA